MTQLHDGRRYLLFALLISFILALIVQLPRLGDPYMVEKDFRNFYLVHRLQNPALFPGQGLTYLELASPAYTLLLWGGSMFLPPALFAKLLIFPLLLASVYFIFRIGERLKGPGTGLALALGFAVFNLAADTEVGVTAGLQRSFAVPLLLALLYFLFQRRSWPATGVVLLIGLIYLPVVPVAALTTLLVLGLRRDERGWRLTLNRRQLLWLLLALVVIVVAVSPLLLGKLQRDVVAGLTALRDGRHMIFDPTYGVGGRQPMFVFFPISGRAGFVSGPSTFIQVLLLGALALLVWAVRRGERRRLPPELRMLLVASLIAFGLSWLGILLTSSYIFYLPSRHTESAFFLLLLIFVFINLEETLHGLAAGLRRHPRLPVGLAFAALLLAMSAALAPELLAGQDGADGDWAAMRGLLLVLSVLLLPLLWLFSRRRRQVVAAAAGNRNLPRLWLAMSPVLLLVALIYVRATGPAFHSPSPSERALYDYLQTLPPEARIAGDPCSLDDVPFYGRRQVLYSCWRFSPQAGVPGIDAYYAEDGAQIVDFCRTFDVDVLVADEETLDPAYFQEQRVIHEPYAGQLTSRLEGRRDFVLAGIAPDLRLFEHGAKFVVPCTEEVLVQGD